MTNSRDIEEGDQAQGKPETELSSWWRKGTIIVLIGGFIILGSLSFKTYSDAPPIPEKVVGPSGEVVFTGADIRNGQEVFLRYGLMDNGTIWGHGGYLGPDFSASYLHELSLDGAESVAAQMHRQPLAGLSEPAKAEVRAAVEQVLKENRYDSKTGTLIFLPFEAASYRRQIALWRDYLAHPVQNRGLLLPLIKDPEELRVITAFFAWTAWAAVANRPGQNYSYTNNFPYDPLVGNTPTSSAVFWSALSLISLLAGTAIVLFAFGSFNYLGWKGPRAHVHPQVIPGGATPGQFGLLKFFVIAGLLFLAQVLAGGMTAHYRADPQSFYGLNLSSFSFISSNIFRTWHLQLAIFWIATSYLAGGLLLASALSGQEIRGQKLGINLLFIALVVVVVGSLLGEAGGILNFISQGWYWIGDQGWEYLELGRGWQVLLIIAFIFWAVLLQRNLAPARRIPEQREISTLFLYAALSIPIFYLPALFFGKSSHFSIVDNWRFWIIHLWVESFFELLLTVMVAALFFKLGMVSRQTATRIIYLDAILFLGSGIVGTAHHWYWTGQSTTTMAFAAMYSATEVVPLTLLTLDASDFFRLTKGECDICGRKISFPHKWTFYFMMAVGFWNFVGAGIFGFLVNLPIVSYFEVGTVLTPLHAHTALMGVFGMFAVAFMVFTMRQALPDPEYERVTPYIRVSFWGLNIGLVLMVVFNLFPGGILQFLDVLKNGYWHARTVYLDEPRAVLIEWLRLPADLVFIFLGVVPLVISLLMTYREALKKGGN